MPGMIKAPDFVGYFPLNPKGMSGAFNKIESSAEKKERHGCNNNSNNGTTNN